MLVPVAGRWRQGWYTRLTPKHALLQQLQQFQAQRGVTHGSGDAGLLVPHTHTLTRLRRVSVVGAMHASVAVTPVRGTRCSAAVVDWASPV